MNGVKYREKFTGMTYEVIDEKPHWVRLRSRDTGESEWMSLTEFCARFAQVRKVAL